MGSGDWTINGQRPSLNEIRTAILEYKIFTLTEKVKDTVHHYSTNPTPSTPPA